MAFLTGYEPTLTYSTTISIDGLVGAQTQMLGFMLYELKGAYGSVQTVFGNVTIDRVKWLGSDLSLGIGGNLVIDVGFLGTVSHVTYPVSPTMTLGQTMAYGTDIKVEISVPCKEYIDETRYTNWPLPEEGSGDLPYVVGYNTMPNKDNDYVAVKQYLVTSDAMSVNVSNSQGYSNSYSVANPNISLDSDTKFQNSMSLSAYSFEHSFYYMGTTVVVNPGNISAGITYASNQIEYTTAGYSGTVDGVTLTASATGVSISTTEGRYVTFEGAFWPCRDYTFTVNLFDIEGNRISETVNIIVPKATDHTHSATQTVENGYFSMELQSTKYSFSGSYYNSCTWSSDNGYNMWQVIQDGTNTVLTSVNVDKLIQSMVVYIDENSLYSTGLDKQLTGEIYADNYRDTRIQGKGATFEMVSLAYVNCFLDLFPPSRYSIVAGEAVSDGEAYDDVDYVESDIGDALVTDGKWVNTTYTLGYISNGTKLPAAGSSWKLGYIEAVGDTLKREFGLAQRVDWSTGRYCYIVADCYDASNNLITNDINVTVTTLIDDYTENYDADIGSATVKSKVFSATLHNSKAEFDLANPTNCTVDEIEYSIDTTAGDTTQNEVLNYPFPQFDSWRYGVSNVKELTLQFHGASKVRLYAVYIGNDNNDREITYHICPSHEGWWNIDRWDENGRFDGDLYFTRRYGRPFFLAYLDGKLIHSEYDILRLYRRKRDYWGYDLDEWYDRETFTKTVRTLNNFVDGASRRTTNIYEIKQGGTRTEGDLTVPTITNTILGKMQVNVCWYISRNEGNAFEARMSTNDITNMGSFGVVYNKDNNTFTFNDTTMQYNFDSIWYWPMKSDAPYCPTPLTFAKVFKGNIASTYQSGKTATLTNTQTYDTKDYLHVGTHNPYDATVNIDDKSYSFVASTVEWPETYINTINAGIPTTITPIVRVTHDRKGFFSRTTHVINRTKKGLKKSMLANAVLSNNQIIARQDETTGAITLYVYDKALMAYHSYNLLDIVATASGYKTGVTINPTGFSMDAKDNHATIAFEVTKSGVTYLWIVSTKQDAIYNKWRLHGVIQISA